MHEFNQSLKYDKRMYAADVKGSIAFSKALLKAGIVTEAEQKEIERGLKVVESEWAENKVRPRVGQTMASALTPVRDPGGRRGHPHRQREAFVGDHRQGHWRKAAHRPKQERPGRDGHAHLAGELAEFCMGRAHVQMEETTQVEAYLKDLLNVMVSRAEKEVDAVMPGYTHLQVSSLAFSPVQADGSEPNRSDGRTCSSPTPNRSCQTLPACVSSSPEFRSSHSDPPRWPVTRTRSTESSSAPNLALSPSARTRCTPSRTETSLSSGSNGPV